MAIRLIVLTQFLVLSAGVQDVARKINEESESKRVHLDLDGTTLMEGSSVGKASNRPSSGIIRREPLAPRQHSHEKTAAHTLESKKQADDKDEDGESMDEDEIEDALATDEIVGTGEAEGGSKTPTSVDGALSGGQGSGHTDASLQGVTAVDSKTGKDSNADDGNTDGNTHDGSTDDANTDDANTDDANTDDGNTDDGNTDNDDADDGNTDDDKADADDGNTDNGNTDSNDDDADDAGETDKEDGAKVSPSDDGAGLLEKQATKVREVTWKQCTNGVCSCAGNRRRVVIRFRRELTSGNAATHAAAPENWYYRDNQHGANTSYTGTPDHEFNKGFTGVDVNKLQACGGDASFSKDCLNMPVTCSFQTANDHDKNEYDAQRGEYCCSADLHYCSYKCKENEDFHCAAATDKNFPGGMDPYGPHVFKTCYTAQYPHGSNPDQADDSQVPDDDLIVEPDDEKPSS